MRLRARKHWQFRRLEYAMSPVKQAVLTLLNNLPDDCSVEDIQYHLYVLEKVRKEFAVAEVQGTVSQ